MALLKNFLRELSFSVRILFGRFASSKSLSFFSEGGGGGNGSGTGLWAYLY